MDLKLANNLLGNLNDGIFGNKTSHIRLRTGEGDLRRITVDLNGWSTIDREGTDKCYETFEMLMMEISEDFKTWFGTKLSEKLKDLQNQQEEI